jgi:uncharacterized repeat protein (TIGR01451 family)
MSAGCSSNFDSGTASPAPQHRSRLCALLAVVVGVCAFALPTAAAFAEGSVDINTGPGTATRQALQMPATSISVPGAEYTVLYVYAQAGETIQLGSSATTGTSNILVYAPGTNLEKQNFPGGAVFGTDIFDCDTNAPGTGVIATRAQELAGPLPNAGGYNPCQFTAPASGIYPVIMMPPSTTTGNAGGGTVNVPVQNSPDISIAMWDITVRSGGAVQPGRVFSYQYNLRTDFTSATASGVEVFAYTKTGYEYQVDFQGQAGGNWSLFSDDQGVINSATGERLFASFACNNDIPPSSGCIYNQAALAPYTRHYPLFLNRPDPLVISGPGGLAATAGYATSPIAPSSNPLAAAFSGSGGQSGVTNRGSSGTISFTSPSQMAGLGYTLAIDMDRNGAFGGGSDVVDTGELSGSGSNSYAWNGRDANGSVPACGDYQYQLRSSLSEVHFAMNDVEQSAGTRIERLSLPGDPTLGNPLAVSYNDRDPFKSGYAVTNATPTTVTDGISGPGFHAWGPDPSTGPNGTGNTDFIDTWSRLPEIQTTGTLRLLCADVQVTKSGKTSEMVPGKNFTYRLAVKNNGPDTATNVVATDKIPSPLTFVSASSGCANASGTVTCTLGSLAAGDTHTFEITVKVPSSLKHCVDNTAKVTNDTPDPNLANNESSYCAPIKPKADLRIKKDPSRTQVGPGGQVMYTLVVVNDGPSDASGVKVSDPMADGLSLVSAQPSQGTCSTAGGKVSCNIGDLAAGGSAQVLVTATMTSASASPTGPCGPTTPNGITNTSTVSSDNEDPTPSNNTDSATVCPTPGPEPKFDLVVIKTASKKSVYVGQPLTYTVTVTNKGPDAAPNAKVTDTLNHPASVVSVKSTQGTCTKTLPMTCQLGTVKAGGKVTITVKVKLREDGCKQRNAASATGAGTDTNPANNLARVDVCAKIIDPLVTKVADRTSLRAGNLVGYTIRVTNPTPGEAQNVKVCDKLPSGLVYVSSTPKAKFSKGQYCWTIKTLRAHETRSYRITVRALSSASGDRVNHVTLSADGVKTKRARAAVHVLAARATGGGVTG